MKVESSWTVPEVEITKVELRKLVATSLYLGVRFSFSSYLYSFGGITFKQQSGGPIGSRLTMACSRIVMLRWGRKMKEVAEASGIKLLFGKYYVDDVRVVTRLLRNGEKFNIDKIEHKPEWETNNYTRDQAIQSTREEMG